MLHHATQARPAVPLSQSVASAEGPMAKLLGQVGYDRVVPNESELVLQLLRDQGLGAKSSAANEK